MREGYDVAQVCLNGHTATSSALSYPEYKQDYCEECGEKTIMACPNCKAPIRGYHHIPGIIGSFTYFPPAYCIKCGHSFPWTERKIRAVIDLIMDEEKLTSDEEKQLNESIKEILHDSPRTQLGATRFNRFMKKASQQTTEAVRSIIIDIVSETAKKIIWPN